MPDPIEGYIAHQTARRLRFRLPSRRRDVAYFDQLASNLNKLAGVEEVTVNPATASVLIVGDVSRIWQQVEESGHIALQEAAVHRGTGSREAGAGKTLIQHGRHALSLLDRGMTSLTGSRDGLRSVILVGFVGAGFYQLSRGNVLGPAITMFWRAGELLEMWGSDPITGAITADEMTPSA